MAFYEFTKRLQRLKMWVNSVALTLYVLLFFLERRKTEKAEEKNQKMNEFFYHKSFCIWFRMPYFNSPGGVEGLFSIDAYVDP